MFSIAWAQDGATAAGGDLNAMLMSALPFILVFAIFYFVLLRPQMTQAKKHTELVAGLKKGDKVVTDGGLIGEIFSAEGAMVQLTIAEGVVVTVAREAVRTTLEGDAAKGFKVAKAETGKKR